MSQVQEESRWKGPVYQIRCGPDKDEESFSKSIKLYLPWQGNKLKVGSREGGLVNLQLYQGELT
jgi:hypothetical protein